MSIDWVNVPGADALYVIGTIIFVLSLPLNILLVPLLNKMGTIRPDLKVLMMSFPCSLCAVIIARLILVAHHFLHLKPERTVLIVHDSAVVYFSTAFIGIGLECGLATMSLNERSKPYLLGTVIVFIQASVAIVLKVWQTELGMGYVTFNIFVSACNVLSLGAFPVLWYLNKRYYANSKRNRHLHTLADRYHIKENLYNIHSLSFLASINAFVIFTTSALMFYLNFGLNGFSESVQATIARYLIHAFNMLIAIYTLVFPLVSVLTNANLYEKLPGWMRKREARVSTISEHSVKRTVSAKTETDTYFNHLQNSWLDGLKH